MRCNGCPGPVRGGGVPNAAARGGSAGVGNGEPLPGGHARGGGLRGCGGVGARAAAVGVGRGAAGPAAPRAVPRAVPRAAPALNAASVRAPGPPERGIEGPRERCPALRRGHSLGRAGGPRELRRPRGRAGRGGRTRRVPVMGTAGECGFARG